MGGGGGATGGAGMNCGIIRFNDSKIFLKVFVLDEAAQFVPQQLRLHFIWN